MGGLFANIAACTVAAIFLFFPSLRMYGIAILSIQVIHSVAAVAASKVCTSWLSILAMQSSWCRCHLKDTHDVIEATFGPQAALIAYPLCEPPAWGRRVLSFSIKHGVTTSSTLLCILQ